MRHIVCIIHRDSLTLERDNVTIGYVSEYNGEPHIHLDANPKTGNVQRGFTVLSFTDLDIINDNWQAMKEMQLTSVAGSV